MTDRFERSARVVAEVNGLPGYPFAVIGHPVANDGDDALRAKAEAAVAQIVPLLTKRAADASDPQPERGSAARSH